MKLSNAKYVMIIALMFLSVFGVVCLVFNSHFWDYVNAQATISLFKGEDVYKLPPGDKYVLFDAYYKKGDLINALKLGNQLKDEAKGLPQEIRVIIAGKMGKILRADQRYDFEFMFYDKFLKAEDPEYYHLFRGDSYRAQGDLDLAKEELLKAKKLAKNPEIVKLIDAELSKQSTVQEEGAGLKGEE